MSREPIPVSLEHNPFGQAGDRRFRRLTWVAAATVLLLLVSLLLSLLFGALPALGSATFSSLLGADWNPVTEEFGALPSVYGTLVSSAIALFIAVPVSIGIALFLVFLAPAAIRGPVAIALELLAAIPSIIYGMWGLFVFAPAFAEWVQIPLDELVAGIPIVGALLGGPPLGIGMMTAGIILSVMIIPFISAVVREAFDSVPDVLLEAAYGIGCTTWEVVRHVVLPYVRVPVVGAVMLGLGRALGETMAVTFVIGNAHAISQSLMMPGTSIASTIANEFNEATGELYTASLLALGLVLFVMTFLVLMAARWMLARLPDYGRV